MSDGGGAGRDLVFVSYSHADEAWRERFRVLLKPYVRQRSLQVWDDGYIQVGDRWERKIDEALRRSRVGLLLLSTNFAASDFIADVELPALRAAAEADLLTLFGVAVSAVDADVIGLGAYQWARPPDRPLDLLSEPERNRALVEIAKALVSRFAARADHEAAGLAGVPISAGMSQVTVEALVTSAERQPGALHGVPDPPPHFVARASALASLKAAVLGQTAQRHGISAATRAGLHGAGGIGKTVLATALCRDEEVRRAFPDGIFWLTFGQEPDLLGLQRFLLELATGERADLQSVNLGVLALREALETKSCLVVLDDVWQGAHAAVFDALGPRGRLLVTTRDRDILRALDARTQDVELLPEGDALALLARWAGQPRAALPAEAAQVARECGYLPLALSVAGAQVAGGTRWADLLAKLRAGDVEFLDHAHRSVFKSLSLGVRALSPQDQARYRELAVFPEDVAVPEAIVVRLWSAAGLDAADARALLARLAAKAFLFLEGGDDEKQVKFHDLQGDYLRLVAEDVSAVHGRLLDACYGALPGAEPGPARWASLPVRETYLWSHLLHHLFGAGRHGDADALTRDPRWLAAKIAASGVSSLLADLATLAARLPSEASTRLECALRMEAGWLHLHPEALEGLLYNRLIAEGASAADIARLLPRLHPRVRLEHPVRLGDGRVYRGHVKPVTACAYSPDGTRILSASADGTLREWDCLSGKALRRFAGHSRGVIACAYAPDGTRILSGSGDGTIREWDHAAGTELRRFEGHAHSVTACAYAPDGTCILSGSYDNTLREWDRTTGKELHRFEGHSGGVTACAYSLDGGQVLSASADKTVREWDRIAGKELCRFEGHSGPVTACVYSPDGTCILSGSEDGTLREWDRATGKELRRFDGGRERVTSCAYSPDGTRILSGSEDSALREWDRASGLELRHLEGHSDDVTACAYSPDGRRIVSASWDTTLREWDHVSGRKLHRFEGHSHKVTACTYSPDGKYILSGSDDATLREWDRASGTELRRFSHRAALSAGAYSPDGVRILSAVAFPPMELYEWDRASGSVLRRFGGHSSFVSSCAYSRDGTCVLSSSWDQSLREWDYVTGRELRRFEGHSRWVTGCAYSADGTRVLSCSWDATLREWDRVTAKELRRFEGHANFVAACAYSPDGTRILSASGDKTLREWDCASGKKLRRFDGHSAAVIACVYSPDGTLILSASADQTLKIWSADDGRCLDTVCGVAAFQCVAAARGHIVAGDALGNVWMLACDWF